VFCLKVCFIFQGFPERPTGNNSDVLSGGISFGFLKEISGANTYEVTTTLG
jgi:hypothetical protein